MPTLHMDARAHSLHATVQNALLVFEKLAEITPNGHPHHVPLATKKGGLNIW